MGNKTFTAPPVTMPSVAGGVCPECGHAEMGRKDWVARLFKLRATCPYLESSIESGWGLPGECNCTHQYHS